MSDQFGNSDDDLDRGDYLLEQRRDRQMMDDIRDKGRTAPVADGGPAFPASMLVEGMAAYQPGMSLRDWFAGQALAGLLAVPAFAEGPYADDMRAMRCYEYADAMLKARQS